MFASVSSARRWRVVFALVAFSLLALTAGGRAGLGGAAVAAATTTPSPEVQPDHQQQSASIVTGQFIVLYGHPKDAYYVVNEQDTTQRTLVNIDQKVAEAAGGIENLKNHRVTVSGPVTGPATGSALNAGAVPDEIQALSIQVAPGQAAGAAPFVTGSQAYITLLCKFSDIAAEPHAPAWYNTLVGSNTYPNLDNYYRENSETNINLVGSTTTTTWQTLPQPLSFYYATTSIHLNDLLNDCTGLHNATVDFTLYYGINMVFNGKVFSTAWGGRNSLTLDGVTRNWGTAWFYQDPTSAATLASSYGEFQTVWSHHTRPPNRWPHTRNQFNNVEYQDNWDVMGNAYNAAPAGDPYYYISPHTIMYHKDLAGWVTAAQKFTYTSGTQTFTLEQSALPGAGNYLMAKVLIGGSATHFYTLEARRKVGKYDVLLPSDAVIIHEVTTANSVPAKVVGVPGSTATNSAAYQWTVGEVFTDATDSLTFTIVAATATGFTVTIAPVAVPPTITTISPSSAQAGGAAFTLTVNGTGFIAGSTVRWNGSARTTTVVSSTQVTAAITAAGIASVATVPITVNTTVGTAGAVNFTVTPPLTTTNFDNTIAGGLAIADVTTTNSTLTASGISGALSKVTATVYLTHTYDQDLTITLIGPDSTGVALAINRGGSGDNFGTSCATRTTFDDNAATAIGAGTPPFSGSYLPEVPLSAFSGKSGAAVNGTWTLQIQDAAAGDVGSLLCWGLSLSTPIVTNPAPKLTSISPGSKATGSAAFTPSLAGSNFVTGSVVRWNGSDRVTTFVDSTHLTVAITAADLVTAGTFPITVFNPAPGGGASGAVSFYVVTPPAITSLNPSSATAGGAAFTLQVNGVNFDTSAGVRWNNSPRPSTPSGPTLTTASITAEDIATAGTALVKVEMVTPNGDSYFSPDATFTITATGTPCIAVSLSASPASPQTQGTPVTFTSVATPCSPASYQSWLLPPGGGWGIAQAYSASGTFNWNSVGLASGAYQIAVWARQSGSAASFEWSNQIGYTLSAPAAPCATVSLSASPAPPLTTGTVVTLTSVASPCSPASYQFWVLPPGSAWVIAQAYSTSGAFTWNTSGLAPGTYQIAVWARLQG